MVGNLFGLLAIIVAVLFFAWLARRAWRAERGFAKWPGVIVAALLTVALALVGVVTARGLYTLYAPRDFPVSDVKVAGTSEQVARGEHLAAVVCASCHSTTGELPMAGGQDLSREVGLPLGSIYPPNLTPAGEIASWSDGEIIRAIRQGAHKSGRPLLKPVAGLRHLSDVDAQAIVSYLRRQPSVQNVTPETSATLLLVLFVGAGLFDLSAQPITAPVVAPAKATNVEYGTYLASFTDCAVCHGEKLDGHPTGPVPAGPDLSPSAKMSSEAFASMVKIRGATAAQGSAMPWKSLAKMDAEELAALHAYTQAATKR